jgi:hypothetical protein
MKASQILPLTLWVIPGALANFPAAGGRDCEWFGGSIICGSSGASVGDRDAEGRQLVVTTEDQTRLAACYAVGYPSGLRDNPCLDQYGAGCLTGYKRLWCY